MGDHGDGYTTSWDAASGKLEWFHHGVPCGGPPSKAEREAAGLRTVIRDLMAERDQLRERLREVEAPSDELVEAVEGVITAEVEKRLSFNVAAYGTAWTGETEDARFIVGDSARAALKAVSAALARGAGGDTE